MDGDDYGNWFRLRKRANELKCPAGKGFKKPGSDKSFCLPGGMLDHADQSLPEKLKQMLEAELITQDEFDTKKAEILSNI